jgi:hypothetical protein
MKRLTKRGKGICVGLTACFNKCDHAISGCDCVRVRGAINRLAAYEDTGIEPEEIPQWIPRSGRMPKKNEYREAETGELIPLLVCVKGTKYPFRAMYDGKTWGDGISKIDVTHWQPLPHSPKGEKP